MKARWRLLLLFAPLALYVAALNPWFMPKQYDDVLYYFGADSIAKEGRFSVNDEPITDWPPGLSAFIAAPFSLGLTSVWTAKIVVLLFAAVGLGMTYRLFREEGRPFALSTCVLTALIPSSFLMGTRIMAEWPYLAWSMVFLLMLRRLDSGSRTPIWALLTGLVLTGAALTRWVGVFLGVAVVVQALLCLKRAPRRTLGVVLPEIVVGAIGAGLWLMWRARNSLLIAAGEASKGNYENLNYYKERFTEVDPITLIEKIGDLLFAAVKIMSVAGLDRYPFKIVALLPGLVLVYGLIILARRKKWTPADTYAAAYLVLMMADRIKPERYLMPIAPFLIYWFLCGCRFLGDLFHPPLQPRLAQWASAGLRIWIGGLIALNGYLLLVGNLQNGHRGLFYPLYPSGARFYRGEYAELFEVGRIIREDPQTGAVMAEGVSNKNILAFSGRRVVYFPSREPVAFLIERGSMALPEAERNGRGFRRVETAPDGIYRLYRFDPDGTER